MIGTRRVRSETKTHSLPLQIQEIWLQENEIESKRRLRLGVTMWHERSLVVTI